MQCPICNTAVWVGQGYCATCDNYLPRPEEEDRLCPHCGIRVASQQESCHKCMAPLPEIDTAAKKPARSWRHSRDLGLFIGTALIVALLLGLLIKNSSGPLS